jgi:CheY-like chemotaxis protein
MDVNSSSVLPAVTGLVCILDDDLAMLKAVDRLLSSAGLEAHLFAQPLEFLSYAICSSVALAIIDIGMPGMTGLEVQSKLQSRFARHARLHQYGERPRFGTKNSATGRGDRLFC